jgi:hypothetical protein
MHSLIQPAFKTLRIVIEPLHFGRAAKIKAQ